MGTKLQIEESVMAIVIYHHEILYIKELIYGMPKFSGLNHRSLRCKFQKR